MKSAQTNELSCHASSITPYFKDIYLNQTSEIVIITKLTPSGSSVVTTPGAAKLRESFDVLYCLSCQSIHDSYSTQLYM